MGASRITRSVPSAAGALGGHRTHRFAGRLSAFSAWHLRTGKCRRSLWTAQAGLRVVRVPSAPSGRAAVL